MNYAASELLREVVTIRISLLVILLFSFSITSAQTISSTGSGGLWNDTATWVGGVVPGENNDVVINGEVSVQGNQACRNLTVNSGGILQNGTGSYGTWRHLTVNGNFTNDGVCRNHPSGNDRLILDVTGDIRNNNIMSNLRTRFVGQGAQYISHAEGKDFHCEFEIEDTLAVPTSSSDISLYAQVQTFNEYWDLNGNALSIFAGDISQYNVHFVNVKDLYCDPNANLNDLTFNGALNIYGTAIIGGNVKVNGNVTVKDTLQNGTGSYGTWRHITVNGNFTNDGVCRNHPSGYDRLIIDVTGNLSNNNIMANLRTRFVGQGVQYVSHAKGKDFHCEFEIEDTLAVPTSSSEISLYAQVQTFNEYWDLNGNALSIFAGDISQYNVHFVNVKDLYCDPNANLNDLTFNGALNIYGTAIIGGNVKVNGNVTVKDTLQNGTGSYGTWRHITVNGEFVNEGVCRNHPSGYDRLIIDVTGNISNNNIMTNQRTRFLGQGAQHVRLAEGKGFRCEFAIEDTLAVPTSATDIVLYSSVWINGKAWDLAGYALTINAGDISDNDGHFINAADIHCVPDAKLNNLTFDGNLNIYGTATIDGNVTVNGTVTVKDTLQNGTGSYGTWRHITVNGDFVNDGVCRNHPSGYDRLIIDVLGNLHNNNVMTNEAVRAVGEGECSFDIGYDGPILIAVGENIVLTGDNHVSGFRVDGGSACQLRNGAWMTIAPGGEMRVYGEFSNNGSITTIHPNEGNRTYDFWGGNFKNVTETDFDTLYVTSHGNQTPATYGNAARGYWGIRSVPAGSIASVHFRFYYDDGLLGPNDETMLELYRSEDYEVTWKQQSIEANTSRNTDNNYVDVEDIPCTGSFLLSSFPDPTSVRPSVIMSIIGRDGIRVGPPNRYTFHYVNASNAPTNEMIIMLFTEGAGVTIEEVHPSMQPGGEQIVIPIDSLTYDGKKDTALLWVGSMQPYEERSFDVICKAVPDRQAGINGTDDTELVITLGGIIAYAAGAIVVTYVKDVGMNIAEEIWRPVAPCETVSEALGKALKESFRKTNKSWFSWEKPAKAVMDQVKDDVLDKIGASIPGKDLVEATGRTVKGMNRYLEGDFKNVKDCSGKKREINGDGSEKRKNMDKLYSWDPNEKVAPDGFSDMGYITSAGSMEYQILFENKKEATAPAWAIEIVDTLSDVFDPSTVKFGKTSHEGEQYDWDMSVNGNIVRWYIEDIELPPNVTPPEGEGFVSFTVKTKDDLPSGTEIRNRATIVFDLNPPIHTNEVVNTLDFTAPMTTMEPIAASVDANVVTVSWTAEDPENGSGVATTTVYASMNDRPYFAVGTTDGTSLEVPVNGGNTYSFYALAKDNVGNAEMIHPEVVTTDVITGVEEEEALPEEYALSQNYPNPFNPVTNISYALPFESTVVLEVFNVLGQRVERLVEIDQCAGSYSVQWDGSGYASGIYFLHIDARSADGKQAFINTMKMMLLK